MRRTVSKRVPYTFEKRLKLYRKLFKEMWKLLEETKSATCFDCGKPLTKETACFMCDEKGFLQFCPTHTWHRIALKETWDKVFESHGGE